MFQIIGILLLFGLVFGSYLISGGKMEVILHSLPHEMMAIGGAGVAAFLISNSVTTMKATLGGLGKAFAGTKWKKKDYKDLLSLLFQLTKTMKSKGVIALESHIEKPAESAIFQKYPKVLKDHFATDFICDTLRMMTMNLEDPHQIEDAWKSSSRNITTRPWRRPTPSPPSPTPCPPWASSPPFWGSSRPWARSASRRKSWAA
jgi:chemotaxis protein MotA